MNHKILLQLEDVSLVEEIFKPNHAYLVYYPQLKHHNKEIQESINSQLRELSRVKKIPKNVQLDYSYFGQFSVEFVKKHLLVLELSSFEYPYGATHGMPKKDYIHINLVTGQIYQLQDLFKAKSNYVKVLSDIILNQIKSNPKYSYLLPDDYKGIKREHPFFVAENSLTLFFAPNEIAPDAAGFPTFTIAFSIFRNLIDINGSFWRSFHH